MSVRFLVDGKVEDSGDCFRNLNLLAHAQMLELSVGSQCGGHGRCGADRVILSPEDQLKVNPPNEIERFHLSEADLKRGVRLACQCFPNEDGLTIDVKVGS